MIRSRAVDLIVVDSVSALVPRAELEGAMGHTQVGGQARLMSSSLRKLVGSNSKSGSTLVFLNQLRLKVGVMYGNPETTSGGNALAYYASVRVDVRNKGQVTENGSNIGVRINAKVKKNKTAPPLREAGFDLLYAQGIDSLGCLVDTAEAVGVLTRKGAYYYLDGEMIAQGRSNTINSLKEDLEAQATIEARVRNQMAGVVPEMEEEGGEGVPEEREGEERGGEGEGEEGEGEGGGEAVHG